MKNLKKGFTLIELMIVVAIIAILAAVAGPKFGKQIKKSRDAKAVETAGVWKSAFNLNYADNEQYATTFGGLYGDVDSGALKASYAEADRATALTNKPALTSASSIFLRAGTNSADTTNNSVQLSISGTAMDSEIVFNTGTGTDTMGNAWSSK